MCLSQYPDEQTFTLRAYIRLARERAGQLKNLNRMVDSRVADITTVLYQHPHEPSKFLADMTLSRMETKKTDMVKPEVDTSS